MVKPIELFPGVMYLPRRFSAVPPAAPHSPRRVVALENYLRVLCREAGILIEDLRAKDNRPHLVKIRREFAQAAREQQFSLPAIGAVLNRHHSTVLHLLRSCPHQIKLSHPKK